jgi:hypothetical protein
MAYLPLNNPNTDSETACVQIQSTNPKGKTPTCEMRKHPALNVLGVLAFGVGEGWLDAGRERIFTV